MESQESQLFPDSRSADGMSELGELIITCVFTVFDFVH
jgi:hypothetical protein